MSSLIAAWLWGGSDGTNQVKINEGGGWVTLTLTTPRDAVDWLTQLVTLANLSGSLSNSYSLSVDTSTGYVTIQAGGGATFNLEFVGSLPSFFGFASGPLGSATSHTSSTQPLGLYALPGVTYTGPRPLERVDLRDYRYGRANAYSYWQGDGFQLEVYGEAATVDAMLAGPVFNGTIRVYPDVTEGGGFDSGTTNGILDLSVRAVTGVDALGAGDSYKRVTLDTVRRTAALTLPAQGYPRLASGLPYGWRFMYAMKIEGIEYLFTEADTGAGGGGYTVSPTLVIDGSSSVGSRASRTEGIGVGYDLVFRLQRSDAMTAMLQRPTFAARITANVDPTDTGIIVDDTTGLPTSSPGTLLWLGTENIGTCHATSGTNITGLNRGNPGGEWRSFAVNAASGIGSYVTDAPVLWRGRQVKLYAVPVDPFGVVHGADVLDDAVMVWRGAITTDPRPDHDGFVFSAQTDDRKLSRDLGVGIGGRGVFKLYADPLVKVDAEAVIELTYYHPDETGDTTEVQPWSGLTDGGLYPLSKLRAALVDAINGWITTSGFSYVRNVRWKDKTETTPFGGFSRSWYLWAEFTGPTWPPGSGQYADFGIELVSGTVDWVYIWKKKGPGYGGDFRPIIPSVSSGWFEVETQDGLFVPPVEVNATSVEVKLDNVDGTTVPTTGGIKIDAGKEGGFYLYTDATANGDTVVLTLDPSSGPPLAGLELGDLDALNKDFSVTFVYTDSGDPADMMRRMLMSSGRGDNDASYDTLPQGHGYDLANVDVDSFDAIIDGMWKTLDGDIRQSTGVSFSTLFGTMLGLSSRAVVLREEEDGSDLNLAVVRTSLFDTAGYVATIEDKHVVITPTGAEPVRFMNREPAPNSVSVEGRHAGNEFTIVVNDVVSQQAEGSEALSIEVSGFSRIDLAGTSAAPGAIPTWARAMFADRTGVMAYELDVVPWLPVRVGDAVYIDVNHFALFQRATGAQGYTGVGRVVGRRVDLATNIVTLTVYIQGAYSATSLCPSAPIRAYAISPTAPTYVDVPLDYLALFEQHLEGGNDLGYAGGVPFLLVCHDPGNAVNGGLWIDEVYQYGTLCRLKVAAVYGTPSIAVGHHVTVGNSAIASERQNLHLHTDTDGGTWS